MATRKAHSLKWLSLHVLVYGSIMTAIGIFILGVENGLIYGIFNLVLHWITDFFTSKVIVKYLKKPRIFFPLLGMDQLIHFITLYLSLENLQDIKNLIF